MTQQPSHTPGPWIVVFHSDGDLSLHPTLAYDQSDLDRIRRVCRNATDDTWSMIAVPISQAAAAPYLLEAAERYTTEGGVEACNALRAAIQQARGE